MAQGRHSDKKKHKKKSAILVTSLSNKRYRKMLLYCYFTQLTAFWKENEMGTLTLDRRIKALLKSRGLYHVLEYKFHPTRMWRFDYALPRFKVAIEIEGGAWIQGRHTRGAGFINDIDKYNEATALGWRVLRIASEKQIVSFADCLARLVDEKKII